jgi:hypothetical protein
MQEALRNKEMGLYRSLNARQFGLKLIANVTYGYTSAGFSGRMPCAELADSIVQVLPTASLASTASLRPRVSCVAEPTASFTP